MFYENFIEKINLWPFGNRNALDTPIQTEVDGHNGLDRFSNF